MYTLLKDIRNKNLSELSFLLKRKVNQMEYNLEGFKNFIMHEQNRRFVHFLHASRTTRIEKKSGFNSNFKDYISKDTEEQF